MSDRDPGSHRGQRPGEHEPIMSTSVNILAIRKRMGRDVWGTPGPLGPDGWIMVSKIDRRVSVIISVARYPDGIEWKHASMTGPGRPPTFEELDQLHRSVWGETGYSYQVHPPTSEYVNHHADALHLWGRADGKPVLPEFTKIAVEYTGRMMI